MTGIRASLEASIEAKRQSSVIADIISAEDIGKFPDTNLAESLQRIREVARLNLGACHGIAVLLVKYAVV